MYKDKWSQHCSWRDSSVKQTRRLFFQWATMMFGKKQIYQGVQRSTMTEWILIKISSSNQFPQKKIRGFSLWNSKETKSRFKTQLPGSSKALDKRMTDGTSCSGSPVSWKMLRGIFNVMTRCVCYTEWGAGGQQVTKQHLKCNDTSVR